MDHPGGENHPIKNQSTKTKIFRLLILVCILVLPSLLYILFSTGKHNITALPYYGEREAVTRQIDGKTVTDTLYHRIPPFSLINQSGRTVTNADLAGKIYVADFMFTTCPTICPKMATHMLHLQNKLKDHKDILLVSHTVDPTHDTPEVLRSYAETVHADTSRWMFLTGNRDSLYALGVKGYLLPVQEDVLQPGGFLHSEQFMLIDGNGHIRGAFDGTSLDEINELTDAIKALRAGEIIETEKENARLERAQRQ